MILFIRAVGKYPKEALVNFRPDLVLNKKSDTDTDLRDKLIGGIKICLIKLEDCRKRANAEGQEPTVRELGELFLRVKRHAE